VVPCPRRLAGRGAAQHGLRLWCGYLRRCGHQDHAVRGALGYGAPCAAPKHPADARRSRSPCFDAHAPQQPEKHQAQVFVAGAPRQPAGVVHHGPERDRPLRDLLHVLCVGARAGLLPHRREPRSDAVPAVVVHWPLLQHGHLCTDGRRRFRPLPSCAA